MIKNLSNISIDDFKRILKSYEFRDVVVAEGTVTGMQLESFENWLLQWMYDLMDWADTLHDEATKEKSQEPHTDTHDVLMSRYRHNALVREIRYTRRAVRVVQSIHDKIAWYHRRFAGKNTSFTLHVICTPTYSIVSIH